MGVVKRFLPFLLTLAVGLFIASFFVDLTPSRFETRSSRSWKKFQRVQQLRNENEQLRQENRRLTQQLDELRQSRWVVNSFEVPPPPPPAPMAPRRTR